MTIDPTVFRAYDIRGRAGVTVTPRFAYVLGQAFGTHIGRLAGIDRPRIAVGGDCRVSTPELKQGLAAGVMSTGSEVIDLGLSTSPLLYFTVSHWDLAGGINVTGSHNPPDENGFKLVGQGARPIAEAELQRLCAMMQSPAFGEAEGSRSPVDPSEAYFDHLVAASRIGRRFKVVVDAGNGVAGLFAPRLLRALGCDVDELYCDPDPTFPNHLPDPHVPRNVADLQARVKELGADIGVAFDGDGDRLGVVDDLGQRRDADYIVMLLAREMLARKPGSRVLLDMKSSQGVIDDIEAHGGEPVLTRTGHSLIKLQMRAEGVPLGGENSGHMFFEDNSYSDDGLFAACKLLTFLSLEGKPLSAYFPDPPAWYSTPEILIPCSDQSKQDVVRHVAAILGVKYPGIELDGIRANMGNGWGLVRASNTSANLVLRFEARSEARLSDIRQEVTELVLSELSRRPASPSSTRPD